MDSMLSLGMTAVFFLPVFLPFKGVGQLTPYLDPFITIVLSMIMLPIPVKTVFTRNQGSVVDLSRGGNSIRDQADGGTDHTGK